MNEASNQIVQDLFASAKAHGYKISKYAADDVGNGWINLRVYLQPQEGRR